jgi:hypothetical protein
MRMIVEQLVEWGLTGETEVFGENLPQRHFVHHKSQMTRPGLEPRAAAVGSQRLTAWAMARSLGRYCYNMRGITAFWGILLKYIFISLQI